ncbi:MAG TPA: class I SAM-dependent methyltransferase [Vicinamibacterales bacterium]|nr:class I SAM-dependent methyltransferase [Vicinamibacterales bacterium]
MSSGGEEFYRTFSEKQLTRTGEARRNRIERARLDLVTAYSRPPGMFLEIGPGQGGIARLSRAGGWTYSAIEPSPALASQLRGAGVDVVEAFVPPIPAPDAAHDVVYADQVLEHMPGIDAARALVAEARRVLKPGGVFFVVVPDYLKERGFFWDIDYTHNFVTTERRVRQLLVDGGFEIVRTVRSIGLARGLLRDLLAGAALLANLPGLDALSRYTGTEELLFKVRKNLFETVAFVARRPSAQLYGSAKTQ